MSDLYFLRHGVAYEQDEWRTISQSDELRPLTEAGIATIRREVTAMQKLALSFDAIISSPLTRAKQTADLVYERYGDIPLIEDVLLKPGFGLKSLERLRRNHKDFKTLLLVGHEPDFSSTISALIGGGRIVMKKGGLAHVRLYKEDRGELKWLLTPRLMENIEAASIVASSAAN